MEIKNIVSGMRGTKFEETKNTKKEKKIKKKKKYHKINFKNSKRINIPKIDSRGKESSSKIFIKMNNETKAVKNKKTIY